MTITAEIEAFHAHVSTTFHIVYRPPIILAFGGVVDAKLPVDCSCRNLFLTKAPEFCSYSDQLKIPEDYPEWNQFEGYQNLVNFETDAGCLSHAIVLFLESPGAFAELGAFCMDDGLRKLLFIVIEDKHYNSDSFIKLGPIKKIADDVGDEAICVIADMAPVSAFEKHLPDVFTCLDERLSKELKQEIFNPSRTRDRYLLIADLIDLFFALKITELHTLVNGLGVPLSAKEIKAVLRQLALFELIKEVQVTTHKFYVAIKGDRTSYIDYDSASEGEKFERATLKLRIFKVVNAESVRRKAYQRVNGGGEA